MKRRLVALAAAGALPPERSGTQAPACSACAHAVRIVGPELVCGATEALYTCEDERSMPMLKALVLHACGRGGRFFVPAADAERSRAALDGC